MTSTAASPSEATSDSPTRLSGTERGLAAAGFLVGTLAMIPGNMEDGELSVANWAFCIVVAAVTTVLVFALPVRRAGAGWALGLAVLALVADLAFWSGLPMPLAAGAIALGLRARAVGDRPRLATVGLVVAVLAVVAFGAIVVGDQMAN